MLTPKHLHIISECGARRVILIFLGWGMDATPFAGLHKEGYDVTAVWDYAPGDGAIFSRLERYSEIVVIAWSFGVRAAADFLRSTPLPVTRTIAVNGTMRHVHATQGIPPAIFRGTLDGLTPESVAKFRRRMCGSSAAYRSFCEVAPGRSFDSLKAELEVFASAEPMEEPLRWSQAVVSERDMIFPAAAQLSAWEALAPVAQLRDAPHFPDLQGIIDRFVVDKELVAERFSRVKETYATYAEVQADAASALWQKLSEIPGLRHDFGQVLEIGAGNGLLTGLYTPHIHAAKLTVWDIADIDPEAFPAATEICRCDAESAVSSLAPSSVDLALSASTLQWFNAPAKFIRRLAPALTHGGIMALMYYAPGTCREIAGPTGVSLLYPSPDDMRRAAEESGLEILHDSVSEVTTIFPTPLDALRHLRLTGVNALSRNGSASSAARSLLRSYHTGPDGRAPLTYRTAFLIARRP